jgi:hypothetical protein
VAVVVLDLASRFCLWSAGARRWVIGLLVAAVGLSVIGGVVLAESARALRSGCSQQGSAVTCPTVYAGYAHGVRKGRSTPLPWKGSAGVIFKGCNYFHPDRCPQTSSGKDRYDSGAVRIVNSTTADVTITDATVVVPGTAECTFHPWPGLHVTVPAGKQLILTETGGTAPCPTTNGNGKYNFDSSETNQQSCTNDNDDPFLQLSVNGVRIIFEDINQVLNTGGFDRGAKRCGHHAETHAWVPMPRPG